MCICAVNLAARWGGWSVEKVLYQFTLVRLVVKVRDDKYSRAAGRAFKLMAVISPGSWV